MFKEQLVQAHRFVSFAGAELYMGRRIASIEGLRAYHEMLGKARREEHFKPSDYIKILVGNTLQYQGTEHLEDVTGGLLVVGNYCELLPLRGLSITFVVNDAVVGALGDAAEPSWVESDGSNSLNFIKFFTEPVHTGFAKSVDNILVGKNSGSDGAREIHRRLEAGRVVALFPEGEPGKDIRRARSDAGRLIGQAALAGISIVGFAAFPTGEGYALSFMDLDREHILELRREEIREKSEKGQSIGDFVMNEVAKRLPGPIRGYYR